MADKNSLAAAILQQNGYVDIPVVLPVNVAINPGTKKYPFNPPPSRAYRDIILELSGGITPAMVTQIQVKPNGQPLQTITAQELDVLNQYFQSPSSGPDAAGTYRLNISQMRQRLIGGNSFVNFASQIAYPASAGDMMESTILNCGAPDANDKSINLLEIEVQVTNATVAGSMSLIALAEPSYLDGEGPGLLKVIDQNAQIIGVGNNITFSKNAPLLYGDKLHTLLDQLFLFVPADSNGNFAILDNFRLWFNKNEVRNRSAAQNTFIQDMFAWRNPQPGLYVIDFTETGLGDKSLPIGDPSTDLYLQFNAANPAGAPATPALPGNVTIVQVGAGYLW